MRLDAEASTLEVRDVVTFEAGTVDVLELAGHLEVVKTEPRLKILSEGSEPELLASGDLLLPAQRLQIPAEVSRVELVYEGRYDFGRSDRPSRYDGRLRQTPGLVAPEGVYLAASSRWVATPPARQGVRPLVSFELAVEALPEGWHVISQGSGDSRGESAEARWSSGGLMEEIFLVGGPLRRYRDRAGEVETLAYLRADEPDLARTYLETTEQYLGLYGQLIGDYPYGKFALVENFWESGYGMPSFTLLGSRVLRFPFILHSSYPHELLHNYWGNGVLVDWNTGNWSEGLTAYLADHLVQEQRGSGAEYRHDTLKRYLDYVQAGRDFPLRDFRARRDSVTAAVGYGKTLMGFHMLRRRLGDEAFTGALRAFYGEHFGARASFADWRQALEEAGDLDLESFFEAWTERPGAPALSVMAAVKQSESGGYGVGGLLLNTGAPWPLEVPLAVTLENGDLEEHLVRLDGAEVRFSVSVSRRPVRLDIDPEFDLFRTLDPRETGVSVGTLFGAPRLAAIVGEGYEDLPAAWGGRGREITVLTGEEAKRLPEDRSLWIFGREHPLLEELGFRPHDAEGEPELPPGQASVVKIRRHPSDPSLAIGWVYTELPAALPGLARKVPRYGTYADLAFVGEEPSNVSKERGVVTDSPLALDLRLAGSAAPLPERALGPRRALAELPGS
ncbi:MAG: M1 family aminopeptidase [Acidobacteriota bacterium]